MTTYPNTPQQPSGMPYGRYKPFVPIALADRTWPSTVIDQGAALVRRRSPRRQPGPDRPDDPAAQAGDVQAARRDGLQGDRGRLPEREPDRLRLRPPADRGRPHPRRRGHPGADAVPRTADRPHLPVAGRRQAGHRALLQLDVDAAAPRRVRPRQGRHHRHRDAGCAAVHEVRRDPHARHQDLVRVLAGVLHRHRARLRARGLLRPSSRSSTRRRTGR